MNKIRERLLASDQFSYPAETLETLPEFYSFEGIYPIPEIGEEVWANGIHGIQTGVVVGYSVWSNFDLAFCVAFDNNAYSLILRWSEVYSKKMEEII